MTLTALAKASIINTEAKLRTRWEERVGVYSAPPQVVKQHNFCEGTYLLFNTSFYKPIAPGWSSKKQNLFYEGYRAFLKKFDRWWFIVI